MFLSSGSLAGALCGGYILGLSGYIWIHWTNVILSAICFTLSFFFQPETLFNRGLAQRNAPGQELKKSSAAQSSSSGKVHMVQTEDVEEDQSSERDATSYAPYTFARSLKMGTYRSGFFHRYVTLLSTLRLPGGKHEVLRRSPDLTVVLTNPRSLASGPLVQW